MAETGSAGEGVKQCIETGYVDKMNFLTEARATLLSNSETQYFITKEMQKLVDVGAQLQLNSLFGCPSAPP